MRRGDAPTVGVRCCRRHWPIVFNRLIDARVGFTTTRATCYDLVRGSGHVELLLPRAAVGLLGELVVRLDASGNPWPTRLPAGEGRAAWANASDHSELRVPYGWREDAS